MHADLTTEDRLRALVAHAEYGHLEGQDYDTAIALVVEVRRLRAGIEAHREEYAARMAEPLGGRFCVDCGEPWAEGLHDVLWSLMGPSDRKDNQNG